MRRIFGTSLAVSLVVVAAGAIAQTPAPTVQLRPPSPIPSVKLTPLEVQRPPSIADARRALKPTGEADRSAYTDGPLSYEVEVVNPGSAPLRTTLLVKPQYALSGRAVDQLPPVPVNVPAGSRAWVKFTDPQGLMIGCGTTIHLLELEGIPGQKSIWVKPACLFNWKSSTISDPHAGLSPDRRVALTTGRSWFSSPNLVSRRAPKCGDQIEFEATVGNAHASQRASGEFLLDANGGGNPDHSDAGGQFSLAPGQQATPRFRRPFEGRARSKLSLKANSTSQVPAIQGSSTIEVTRLCSISSVELK
ncbi:MAG TPA: hypothetical protein VM580_05675 [Labilithrix sp.]|nr:hypothetical protein [Labilithrix sp.]